jgi:hypothetical protein
MRFKAVSSIWLTVLRDMKAIWQEAFSQAFNSLYEQCKHCAEVGGDYIE